MKKITLLKMGAFPKGLFFACLLASFLTTNSAKAQFCNNEIVYWSDDFATGFDGDNADVINLSYEPTYGLVSSGMYRVSSLSDLNVGWHKFGDHTPNDMNGRMIVINGKQGDIYQKAVTRSGGYPAGFYAVSFYVMNVDKPGTCNPALLPTLSIKGEYLDENNNWVALQNSPSVGFTIPETINPVWVGVGNVFTLPTTGSFLVQTIRFTISDDVPGGCGNDFALDDIKLATCPEGGPLPVQFLSIAAQKKGSGVNILWSTATEADNEYFEVERSIDGGNTWYPVSKTKGSGTSSIARNYTAYDAKPNTGTNYYRIKQVDKDGTAKYSATAVYKLTIEQTDISVLANPFNRNITVDFLSNRNQTVNSRLFDNTGKQVLTQQINIAKGSSRKTIETANLNRGMYILQVTDENGQILYSDKLIKQ